MLLLPLIFLLPCVSGDLSKLDGQCSEFKSMIVPVFSAALKSRDEKGLKVTRRLTSVILVQYTECFAGGAFLTTTLISSCAKKLRASNP